MAAIAVQCEGGRTDGWTCSVTVHEDGIDVSSHVVLVAASDLERLAPDAADPTALVRASFAFLLERESPQLILPSFELTDIARYFPEYEATIRKLAQAH